MAIDNAVALWNENAGSVYNAREYRRMLNRLMGFDVSTSPGTGAGGIFRGTDLEVSAGGGQSVNVAAGACFVRGSESSHQAGYFVYNDATVNVVLSAADATNPRIDIVGVQIRDSEFSGANNDARILVVTGTPAGSPAEPALPANFLTLARVDVPANDNTVSSGQIINRRRMMALLGGIVICTSTSRPTVNLFEGLFIYETDTHKLLQYTTSTTGWTPPWNMPWGTVGYATRATDGGPAVAFTDIGGITATFTAVANRRYRTTIETYLTSSDGVSVGGILIVDGSGNQLQSGQDFCFSDTIGCRITTTLIETLSAGSVTRAMKFGVSAGAGSITLRAGSTYPTFLLSEDVGPVGAPA